MHRADVDEPPHAVFPAERQHVFRAVHIDVVQPVGNRIRDIDQPGRVQHKELRVLRIRKKRAHRIRVAHVAGIVPHMRERLRGFAGKHKAAHRLAALGKHPHQRAAEMAVRAGHNIDFLHTHAAFLKQP